MDCCSWTWGILTSVLAIVALEERKYELETRSFLWSWAVGGGFFATEEEEGKGKKRRMRWV